LTMCQVSLTPWTAAIPLSVENDKATQRIQAGGNRDEQDSHQPTSQEGTGPNHAVRKSISARTRDGSERLGK